MSKKLNIPTEALGKGSTLALANAKNHLAIADAAARLGHFGQGCSLCVLAAEEGMKALALRAIQTGLVPADDLDEMFTNHIRKHQLAFLLSFFTYWGIVATKARTSTQKDIDEGKTTEKEAGRVWMSRTTEEMQKIGHPESSEEFSFLTWYRDANASKKKGFYVDWNKESWATPADIGSKEFERYRASASWWMGLVEVVHSAPDDELKAAIELGNQAMNEPKSTR